MKTKKTYGQNRRLDPILKVDLETAKQLLVIAFKEEYRARRQELAAIKFKELKKKGNN